AGGIAAEDTVAGLIVDEVAQALAVADIRSVTGFPDRALKESNPVKIPNLRGRAIDLAADRVRAPDQIAFRLGFGISARQGRVLPYIARHGRCPSYIEVHIRTL